MVVNVGPTAPVRRERLRPMFGQVGIFVMSGDASMSTPASPARDAAMFSQQCCQRNS
jgi:hypothetical protein